MANEAPKIARLATETVSPAANTAAHAAAQAATSGAQFGTARMAGFAEAGAAQARTAMERGLEQASKAAEEMADFSRGNAETLAQVAQTWMTGTQDLSRQAFALMQGLTDHAMEGARALSGVKSLKEAAEIQATYARGAMDRVMAETAKLQEASFRLAEQVATPVTQRVTLAMERAAKPIAA